MSNMNRVVDYHFFEQPGFDVLYSTWSEVFELNENGEYALSPAEALKVLRQARLAALGTGITTDDATALEHVACRYAQELSFQASEAQYE